MLEELTEKLFNMCLAFRTSGIRTSTNQINSCVRNKWFLNFGIYNILGSHFYIECKNEAKTPSGTYLSKLYSIISAANAGERENV